MKLPYSSKVDMWSLGCICVELITGQPLFPGHDSKEQLAMIVSLMGMPPEHMINGFREADEFFVRKDDEGKFKLKYEVNTQESSEHSVLLDSLEDIFKIESSGRADGHEECFLDFVRGLLQIDPELRWSPREALDHPFITRKEYLGPYVPDRNE